MSPLCVRTFSIAVFAAGPLFVMNACGGATTGGVETPDANAKTCTPLPGCSSTTQCPSDCNTCTCDNGMWACTLIGCIDDGGIDGAQPDVTDGGRTPNACTPLPGCSSTTQCPSDCNTCTCDNGMWACTLKLCPAGGGAESGTKVDEAGGFTPDGGGYCCPPDPHPGCCMNYGGWSATASSCGIGPGVCDGMPWPNDPAWHIVSDSHGCPMWSSEGSTGLLCGQFFDSGFIPRPSDGAATD